MLAATYATRCHDEVEWHVVCTGHEAFDLLERVRNTYKYRPAQMSLATPEGERPVVEAATGTKTMAVRIEGDDRCDDHVKLAGPARPCPACRRYRNTEPARDEAGSARILREAQRGSAHYRQVHTAAPPPGLVDGLGAVHLAANRCVTGDGTGPPHLGEAPQHPGDAAGGIMPLAARQGGALRPQAATQGLGMEVSGHGSCRAGDGRAAHRMGGSPAGKGGSPRLCRYSPLLSNQEQQVGPEGAEQASRRGGLAQTAHNIGPRRRD